MICMKKLTFSSHLRAIVKPQEPPSPAELTFETQLFFFPKATIKYTEKLLARP